jgi:DNA replication and repair protein RecF
VYVSRLSLQNYRNYTTLDLRLSPGTAVFLGANAQGKSNLLEAIYLLASIRAPRSRGDADLIRSGALGTEFPAARVSGSAQRRHGEVDVTITIGAARDATPGAAQQGRVSKRLQVNGVSRRASDVVGQITAVLFTAQDIDIVTGAPALRRRYLDVTLSQARPHYLRALQRYTRVLLQRNMLLRRIHERAAGADQLAFWDQELAAGTAIIASARSEAIAWLDRQAGEMHTRLSGGGELLEISYRPQLPRPLTAESLGLPAAQLQAQLLDCLHSNQRREIEAGVSLFGPHRDELAFTLDGAHLAAFGSRAQQRTAVLALRLAEAGYIEQECEDKPVLLLDDILSELDQARRCAIIDVLNGVDQILITATEAEPFGAELLGRATRYRVGAGTVTADI